MSNFEKAKEYFNESLNALEKSQKPSIAFENLIILNITKI